MSKGERVLAVLNLCVRIRVATSDTDHSVTASTQSIAAAVPEAARFSIQVSQHRWL